MKRRSNISATASHRTGALAAALIVIALVFSLFSGIRAEMNTESIFTPDDLEVVGSDLSAMATTTIGGSSITGAVFSQKSLTVLHFFATWSPECGRELPYMQHALNTFGSGEIAVYGLLYEDATSTPESCAALFEQLGLSFDCLRLDSVLTRLVSVYPMLPQTFLVNSNGVVVDHFPGTFTSAAALEALIEHELGHPSIFHEVRFIDGLTGELILEVNVPNGGDATPPTPPTHEEYAFVGWEGSYTNVTEDRVIIAAYLHIGDAFLPGDVDLNGSISTADALITLRHVMGTFWDDNVYFYGDYDCDGSVTVVDAILILRHALGLF